MLEQSVITRTITMAGGVYAPGHLGELTQIVDFDLVDAVLEETAAKEKRLRLLPSQVAVYFTLALALFEYCSYLAVWDKLTAVLGPLDLVRRAASSLSRARRRMGTAPLRRLFETLAGPLARPGQAGSFYRGLRTVALDGTHLHTPDLEEITWHYPKRSGPDREFGYPLLRLLVIVECGTRAVLAAAFGPENECEIPYARRLLGLPERLDAAAGPRRLRRRRLPAGHLHHRRAVPRPLLRTPTPHPLPAPVRRLLPGPSGRPLPHWTRLQPAARPRHRGVDHLTLADGTVRREPWRLVTSLLDEDPYPAHELADLCHRRWQVETTYVSIKATMLDGRVLRSRSIPGLDQEVYALLTVYQAIIRTAGDAITTRADIPMERISFTVLLQAAGDQVTTATGIHLPQAGTRAGLLLGVIGRTLLNNLLPAQRRQRVKARTHKNTTSKNVRQ
ncbi:transposase domain-containing protein [Streptomyces sp. ISL-11]|uniref:transposase domain-containing protein n=1 Tax=Streptomyces sp. ISL-11 TaxID=2819174 RepID=UPI001BED2B15|nr:transposase domain-containing protein [Streptomyces sp. ISL-11]MBT2385117.1 transposase domain-containing protein [Streptomyces sp. ISL-11]